MSPKDAAARNGSAGLGRCSVISVAGAVANAEARYREHEAATHPQGSQIGVLLELPSVPSDFSKHTGGSDATSTTRRVSERPRPASGAGYAAAPRFGCRPLAGAPHQGVSNESWEKRTNEAIVRVF